MSERDNYRFLKWISFAVLFLITVTVGLLYTDQLPLATFKQVLILLLFIAVILLVLLMWAVRITIQRAKQKFKTAESKFSQFYTLEVMGIISSFDGKVTDANDSFLKILGYTRDELLKGKIRWDDITPDEFKEITQNAIDQLQKTGSCSPFEKQYIRKDGSRIWVLVGSSQLTESEAITYVIDVSSKHEAETYTSKLQTIIKQQQEEFRSVFMNAPALITIRRGLELRYDFVNKAVMDLAGRSDHVGKTQEEMYPGTIRSEDTQISKDVYQTGIPRKGSRHRLTYNIGDVEQEIYLDYHITPVYDHEGHVDGVATFGFDVTDLVKANQEMEISKDRFSFIADSLPHKVLMSKTNGIIEYMNNTWLSYLNLGSEEAKNVAWNNIIHPDEMEEMHRKWVYAAETGTDFNMELRLKRADGSYRLHSTRATALKDSEGVIVTWIGTSLDIHEQQEQFKQLAESEVYFRTMADDSPFMIWKSDAEGKCIYVNNKWIQVTGLTFEGSLGFGYSQVMDTSTEEEKKNWLEAVNKQIAYQAKFRLKQANGESRWVIAQSNPYYIDGIFAGYIGSIADITDQEMAAQTLKELSDKKDEFISIASHELKTPLTSIQGFTQILLKNLDEDSKAYVFGLKIHEHSLRLENLIANLLDVSKINSGKLIYQKSTFTLESLIRESVENVQYLDSDHEIIIEPIPDIKCYGDKFRLEEVLNNLLTNAIKYSPDSLQITIKCRLTDTAIKVSVEDNGIGISPENISKLFTRFYRIDNTSMRYQGLGLGLYISAEIIKHHNGKMGVDSIIEKGSSFWFELPLANEIEHR